MHQQLSKGHLLTCYISICMYKKNKLVLYRIKGLSLSWMTFLSFAGCLRQQDAKRFRTSCCLLFEVFMLSQAKPVLALDPYLTDTHTRMVLILSSKGNDVIPQKCRTVPLSETAACPDWPQIQLLECGCAVNTLSMNSEAGHFWHPSCHHKPTKSWHSMVQYLNPNMSATSCKNNLTKKKEEEKKENRN